jgi:hypothetical protein
MNPTITRIRIICLTIFNEEEHYNYMKLHNEEHLKFLRENTEIMNDLKVFYIMYKKLDNLEYLIDGNMLYINGEETYIPGILNKTLSAMEIITTKLNIEYEFILRTNASTVIDYYELFKYLNRHNFDIENKYYYIGFYYNLSWYDYKNGIYDNTYHGTRFCNGTFMLINKRLILNIVNNSEKLLRNLIDDVSIGQYINTVDNVEEIDIKELSLFNYDNFVRDIPYISYLNNRNKHWRTIDVIHFRHQTKIIEESILKLIKL